MTADIRYINKCKHSSKPYNTYKTKLFESSGGKGDTLAWLLWGDRVRVITTGTKYLKVRARGQTGYVLKSNLGTEPLLEVYVIDVGQGDGVLYRTPDLKWHMVDAGVLNSRQMTKKGAPNFVRWKFRSDLELQNVNIENMIMSHPDADHFGGFINLLEGDLEDGRTFKTDVENFYHSGMARYQSNPQLGRSKKVTVPKFKDTTHETKRTTNLIYELLSDKASFKTPKRKLRLGRNGTLWGSFAHLGKLIGSVPNNVAALSSANGHLPGYGPGENDVTMKVLGPVVETGGSTTGIREFSSESVTRNGHSVIIRLDYGKSRILLTGDTNEESQRLTLSAIDKKEFTADVAKGCHHGSEDIYMKFIKQMAARATVISSGDNEDYAHPRPVVVGASGFYGRELKDEIKKETIPPLVYSTELARSVKLAYPSSLRLDPGASGSTKTKTVKATAADVKSSSSKYKKLERTPISTDLIYGLVNIRTDGKQIMCATMEERGSDFDLKVFKAG